MVGAYCTAHLDGLAATSHPSLVVAARCMRAALITGPPHTNLLSFRGAPFSARARRDSGPHSSRETLAEDCPPSSHTSTSHHPPAPLSLTVARLGAPVSSCVVALSSPVSIHSKTGASPCVGATHRLPCPLSFMHVHAFPGRSLVRTHSCQSIGRGRLRTASRRVASHASGRLLISRLYSSWSQGGVGWQLLLNSRQAIGRPPPSRRCTTCVTPTPANRTDRS